jgi:hypothetical protein
MIKVITSSAVTLLGLRTDSSVLKTSKSIKGRTTNCLFQEFWSEVLAQLPVVIGKSQQILCMQIWRTFATHLCMSGFNGYTNLVSSNYFYTFKRRNSVWKSPKLCKYIASNDNSTKCMKSNPNDRKLVLPQISLQKSDRESSRCSAKSACRVNGMANNVPRTQWSSKDRRTRTERRWTMQRWSMTVTWTVDRNARKTSEGVSPLLFVLLKQGLIRWNVDITVVNQVFRWLQSKKG